MDQLKPPEAVRASERFTLKRVSSKVFGSQAAARSASFGGSEASDRPERASLPRQVSNWLTSVVNNGQTRVRGGPAPRLHGMGGLDGMLERAVNYFTDSDASVDYCSEDIWLIGGVSHDGWCYTEGADTTPKKARRSATTSSPEKSPSRQRMRSALRNKRSRAAIKASAISSPAYDDDGNGFSLQSSPGRSSPPSPSALSSAGSFELEEAPSMDSIDTITRFPTGGWPSSFHADFVSRIQLTYRSSFEPIPCAPSNSISRSLTTAMNSLSASLGRSVSENTVMGLSSDTGWGCMLRTGQSLLANALSFVHLGRDWRLARSQDMPLTAKGQYGTYVRLLTWFIDDPSPLCPFSVHHFALKGRDLGKQVGEWFGPSTAAGAIKSLANSFDAAGLAVVSSVDGTLYRSEVETAATAWKRPVLILLNLRLGIEGVNPIYHASIKALFRLPYTVGIAGGRPSSSYFFVGEQADSLFYIDPHHTTAAVSLRPVPPALQQAALSVPISSAGATGESVDSSSSEGERLNTFFATAYTESDLESFHCQRPRKMALSGLDPSMLVGLLCRSQSEFDGLCTALREMKAPLVGIAERKPAWARGESAEQRRKGSPHKNEEAGLQEGQSSDHDNDTTEGDLLGEPEDAWHIDSSDEEIEAATG